MHGMGALPSQALCHSIHQISIMVCSERAEHFLIAYWGLGFTEIWRHSLLSLTFFSCGSCFAYGRLVGLLWMGRSKVTFRFEKRTVLMEKISGL